MESTVDLRDVVVEAAPAAAAPLPAPAEITVGVHGAYWAVTVDGRVIALWRYFEVEDVTRSGLRAVLLRGAFPAAGGPPRSIYVQLATAEEVDQVIRLLLPLLAAGP